MIDVINLTKTFKGSNGDFKAIDDVSFSVKKGEIYGIIGLSGAGKSTLVRCINRLEEPTSGKIVIDGVDITGLNKKELLEARKEIGMIFQHFNLFSQQSVFDNVAYPLKLKGEKKEQIKTRVEELLKFVGLEEKAKSYPSELSGGQKQRVAIARALATNPKLLLSDESTSALDPQNTKQILDLLKKTVEEFGTTIIMITHQMEVAKEICDRIAVMENGRIVEENDVETIFKHPKQRITKVFIEKISSDFDESIIYDDFAGRVVRLVYDQSNYNRPVLSELARKNNMDFNLISGNISKLHTTGLGYTIVELIGDDEDIERSLQDLRDNKVNVEVIK
ncbi:MAG: ATP-binding cassette domain-containing protein [Finegoldia sp.]|nr:ATP-binding cassette domain-containing protein [Finegoldia sp.]